MTNKLLALIVAAPVAFAPLACGAQEMVWNGGTQIPDQGIFPKGCYEECIDSCGGNKDCLDACFRGCRSGRHSLTFNWSKSVQWSVPQRSYSFHPIFCQAAM